MSAPLQEKTRRLYIQGISLDVTSADMHNRFSSFGTITNIQIAHTDKGVHKGFAHLTLTSTEKSYSKFISAYQNSKWKGETLKIKIATPSYIEKLEKEWATPLTVAPVKLTKKESKRLSNAIHGDNMTHIKDTDALRMGWKKGKYGRLVCVMNMKAHGNARIDPSKTQHLMKRFNVEGEDELVDEVHELEYAPAIEFNSTEVLGAEENEEYLDEGNDDHDVDLDHLDAMDDSAEQYDDHIINLDSLMNDMDDYESDDQPIKTATTTSAPQLRVHEQPITRKNEAPKATTIATDESGIINETARSMSILNRLLKNETATVKESKHVIVNERKRKAVYYSDDDEEELIRDVVDEYDMLEAIETADVQESNKDKTSVSDQSGSDVNEESDLEQEALIKDSEHTKSDAEVQLDVSKDKVLNGDQDALDGDALRSTQTPIEYVAMQDASSSESDSSDDEVQVDKFKNEFSDMIASFNEEQDDESEVGDRILVVVQDVVMEDSIAEVDGASETGQVLEDVVVDVIEQNDVSAVDVAMVDEGFVKPAFSAMFGSQVNTNLRSLVFGEVSEPQKSFGFSLFSSQPQQDTDAPPVDTLGFLNKVDEVEVYDPVLDTRHEEAINFQKQHFFFMHNTLAPKATPTNLASGMDSGRMDRMNISRNEVRNGMGGRDENAVSNMYNPSYTFMLTQSLEDVKYEWERNKRNLTDEFKRKHKSAARKKVKSTRTFVRK